MTKNLMFDQNTVFEQLVSLAQNQGIMNKEAWDFLVDAYIVEKVDRGELDSDQALEQIKTNLKARFAEYQRKFLK